MRIQLVSFKAVKKKLKEYNKKKKRDIGLNYLEFGFELKSELEIKKIDKRKLKLMLKLKKEY